MPKNNEIIEQIDLYIRENYKDDIKKMNGLICLFKTNINNLNSIKNEKDFKVKFKQSDGYQKEMLEIINKFSTKK